MFGSFAIPERGAAAARLQQGRLRPRCPPGGALLFKKESYNDFRITGSRDHRIEGSQALQRMLYTGSDTPWATGPANFFLDTASNTQKVWAILGTAAESQHANEHASWD